MAGHRDDERRPLVRSCGGPSLVPLQFDVGGLNHSTALQWRARVRFADSGPVPQLWGPWQYGGLPGEWIGVHVHTAISPDSDADGWPEDDDCAPLNAAIHPGAAEVAGDEVDQDCDGTESCLLDGDADGGAPPVPEQVLSADTDCSDPGEAALSAPQDCDDSDPAHGPASPEQVADGFDSDCDGGELCWSDADGDGFRDALATVLSADLSCDDFGEADSTGAPDCDDAASTVHPGAVEGQGDGVDTDCDGGELCYVDADNDGYRATSTASLPSLDEDCSDAGEGALAEPPTDCDDVLSAVHPGAAEQVGAGGDENCDGIELCYTDTDNDGYRPPLAATLPSFDDDCADTGEAPPSDPATDCDDASATVFPNQPETPGDEVDGNCDGLEACWSDVDGDGARSAVVRPSADLDCADPQEASSFATAGDCDDASHSVRPGAIEIADDGIDQDCDGLDGRFCWVDADSDGWGGGASAADPDGSCSDDPLQVGAGGDCDDGNPARNPGVADQAGDGVDADCDGSETCYVDGDGDGFRPPSVNLTVPSADADCDDAGEALPLAAGGDCDDADPTVRPGGTEIADDGVDQDCDGVDAVYCHIDGDADGFGSFAAILDPDGSCSGPGQAAAGDDCDDADGAIHPGAPEVVGDGADQNCDDAELCFIDGDSDGFRPTGGTGFVSSLDPDCDDPGEGALAEEASDCDDANPARGPGQSEVVADGVDNDCDGLEHCFVDADEDGYRAGGSEIVASTDLGCSDPGEATSADPGGDCDDTTPIIGPHAEEGVGDGIDQDCDGGELCPADEDADDYPASDGVVQSVDLDCLDLGEGDPFLPQDCNDLSPAIHPTAPEFDGDSVDQDCDGFDGGGSCARDEDGDHWVACLDCDDLDAQTFPGARETCDGRDEDCDPSTADPWPDDADRDGVTGCEGDCDPWDPWVFPGAPEGCDGLDSDCDGAPDSSELDADGDGVRAPPCGGDCDDTDPLRFFGAGEDRAGPDRNCDGRWGAQDADGDGVDGIEGGDCHDGDASIRPGAPERCNGLDDDCDGTLGAGEAEDIDNDGARACIDCDDLDPNRHPAATEECDGLDGDCDGLPSGLPELDADGDGHRPCGGDCNDASAEVHPTAVESCSNGTDDNCDGVIDLDQDLDGDSAWSCADADCDDGAAATAPGAPELCDGRDNDCDGGIDEDFDIDGDGHAGCAADCNDANPAIFPFAPALCGDDADEDCLPSTAEDTDSDGDGFTACGDPADCWEGAPEVRPNQIEHCNGIDDDCDGQVDEALDMDGDGALPCAFDCDDASASVGPLLAEVACDGLDNDCLGDGDACDDGGALPVVRPFGCATSGARGGGPVGLFAGLLLALAQRACRRSSMGWPGSRAAVLLAATTLTTLLAPSSTRADDLDALDALIERADAQPLRDDPELGRADMQALTQILEDFAAATGDRPSHSEALRFLELNLVASSRLSGAPCTKDLDKKACGAYRHLLRDRARTFADRASEWSTLIPKRGLEGADRRRLDTARQRLATQRQTLGIAVAALEPSSTPRVRPQGTGRWINLRPRTTVELGGQPIAAASHDAFTVAELRAGEEGWLALAGPQGPAGGCAGSSPLASALRLVVTVPKANALPVLRRRWRQVFPDGTSIDALPGISVLDGHIPIGAAWYPVPAEVAVGPTYTPDGGPRTTTDDDAPTADRVTPEGNPAPADAPTPTHLRWTGLRIGGVPLRPPKAEVFEVAEARAVPGATGLYDLHRTCVDARVMAEEAEVLAVLGGLLGSGVGGLGTRDPQPVVITAGADLYDVRGQWVGWTEAELPARPSTDVPGRHLCFEVRWGEGWLRSSSPEVATMHLCVAPDDARRTATPN